MSYREHPMVTIRTGKRCVPTRCQAIWECDDDVGCPRVAVAYAMVPGQPKARAVCWVHARALDNAQRLRPVRFGDG